MGDVMSNPTYEIRSVRGTPVYAFDNETRARDAWRQAEKRIGGKLRLFKVIKTEEELT